ncbi:DUF3024 domain-containing protein [Morganella morganii]|uniref:DUF3024 domain-containing protein n=1 Tax=Morganella morganii TaxID=582 RepID=UPI001BDB4C2C|nr:DUF3024 domain-containing protein [Morganella morganii]MBT0422968.1 DUF3024 domain-containing protein [Morganella morganii subsp. morganii]MBT0517566.1 DUF3024 domain-containing protein [Morganella morganii subsp. morganii]QWM05662.1 DUF3024 domain-containing protein [Morganella morganii subsp. morganii]
MTFNDIELAQINQCMDLFMEKRRPPEHLRDEHDLMYEIVGQAVFINETRNVMGRTVETEIAKIVFDRHQNGWRLFCMGRSGQWEGLFADFIPTFSDAIKVVEDDAAEIFFG